MVYFIAIVKDIEVLIYECSNYNVISQQIRVLTKSLSVVLFRSFLEKQRQKQRERKKKKLFFIRLYDKLGSIAHERTKTMVLLSSIVN